MAQVFETVASQAYRKQYAGGDLTAEWVVWGAGTLAAAEAQLWGAISNPLASGYGNLAVKTVQGRNMGAPDLWLFTVAYGSSVPSGKLNPDQLTFRIAAASVHTTQSLATLDQRQSGDAAVQGTNLTVDGTTNTHVTPDGYTVAGGDVGKYLAVTGGPGFATGLYQIDTISGSQWVLSGGPAAAGTAGGVWYLLNGTAPSFGGAIGVSQDTVAGCDINVPAMEVTYSQSYSGGIGDADLRTFRALVGCINNAPFRGYATGTMEYLGCEPTGAESGALGTNQTFVWWALAHRFRYEPDVFGATIGGIVVPYKPGHAYLWVRYAPAVAGNVLTVPPVQINIEQVKPYADFSVLGITV